MLLDQFLLLERLEVGVDAFLDLWIDLALRDVFIRDELLEMSANELSHTP